MMMGMELFEYIPCQVDTHNKNPFPWNWLLNKVIGYLFKTYSRSASGISYELFNSDSVHKIIFYIKTEILPSPVGSRLLSLNGFGRTLTRVWWSMSINAGKLHNMKRAIQSLSRCSNFSAIKTMISYVALHSKLLRIFIGSLHSNPYK